jgi:hypothetical protein
VTAAPAGAGVCYLLHFSAPWNGADGRHIGARHYVGFAADGDAVRRLREHLAGQGSPLVKAVVRAGITVEIAAVVPGDRALERRWHVRHGSRLCPLCRPRRLPAGHQLRLPFTYQPASRRRGRRSLGWRPRPWVTCR